MYPGNGYRVWNRFEDLGANGYTGELYTDRTTGLIYYTPRTDLKETCASINGAGQAIIPSGLETLVKISSATADIAAAGVGAAGAHGWQFRLQAHYFRAHEHSCFHGGATISPARPAALSRRKRHDSPGRSITPS